MTCLCPVCGKPAERASRYDGIYRCDRHGAFEWFARERLGDVDLDELYQSYGYNRSLQVDFERMRPLYENGLRKRVLRHFTRAEGLTFLDIGCANGEYLAAARSIGMSYTVGVEIDREAKTRAEKHGKVFSDMSELGDGDTVFDVVQCKNVLSNIQDLRSFFAAVLQKVKPGGILFLDVLNQFGAVALLKKMLGRPGVLRPPFVINGFSKQSVVDLARRNEAFVISMDTSYVGSDQLPYRRNPGLIARGLIAKCFRAASMIAADIKPANAEK